MAVQVNTDWDVQKYRTKFEPQEHWTLKEEFMNAHKSIIEEERLVCLAQVYANVELLGCKYPAPVMDQVKSLAQGMGSQYKQSRQNKLIRTFAKASDAAVARAKRTNVPFQKGHGVTL